MIELEDNKNFPPPFCYVSYPEVKDFYRRQFASDMAKISDEGVNLAAQISGHVYKAAYVKALEWWDEDHKEF